MKTSIVAVRRARHKLFNQSQKLEKISHFRVHFWKKSFALPGSLRVPGKKFALPGSLPVPGKSSRFYRFRIRFRAHFHILGFILASKLLFEKGNAKCYTLLPKNVLSCKDTWQENRLKIKKKISFTAILGVPPPSAQKWEHCGTLIQVVELFSS